MQSKVKGTVSVLGAGNFGSSLALHLARQNFHVHLWSRNPEVVKSINQDHKNPKYLQHIEFPPNIEAFENLTDEKTLNSSEMIVLALPTQSLREVLHRMKEAMPSNKHLVCVSKGIEMKTLRFPLQIIKEELEEEKSQDLSMLSGPSFAIEIAEGHPTGIAVASTNPETAKKTQSFFHAPSFRVYTNNDPIGLEVAGALKNVICVAAGACKGLGFQNNSLATLITRGLAEITRVGVKLGANPLTFNGLGGVGDLFLSCSSTKSRNYTVGHRLGKGEKLEDILNSLNTVAEGVFTAEAAYKLTQKIGVRAPIIKLVYEVLYEGKALKVAVKELTNGDAKEELELN